MHSFRSLYPNQNQTWEFCHPTFIHGRADLPHEIKREALELHWNPAMKDEVELPGDFRLDLMQNETVRVCGVVYNRAPISFCQEPFQNYQYLGSGFFICEHVWRIC